MIPEINIIFQIQLIGITLKKLTAFIILFTLAAMVMTQCATAAAPTITSFSPVSGPVGSSVTITGAGFSAYPKSNIVFFGATQATVTAATTNSLTVTVPLGATYKYISVLNDDNGLTGYSAIPFNVTFQGNISFATKVNFSTSSSPNSVDIGDLDGDGKSDLVVTCASNLTLRLNTYTSGAVSFANRVSASAGTDTRSACIGDLNGDGQPDLVVGDFNGWDVSIFENKSWPGTLSFGTTGGISTGSGTPAYSSKSVSLGDIDGDGKPDLAVANYSTGKISVFRNTSTLSWIKFESKVDFSTVYAPFWLSIGDLDGDGKPDMVVANRLNSSVSVFRNTSTSGTIDSGSFAALVAFTTGSSPRSIGLGDIDGDGKLDLAVANYSGSVSVLLNTSSSGSINFASKVDISTSGFPISVSVGDIDGDGKPDLVVPLTQTKAVGVFRNTSSSGSVSFAAEQDFAVGIDYWYSSGTISGTVGIGDINGDGKPDLSIFDKTTGNVSVLRQIIPAPSVTSFTPTSAGPGDTVTITGTNFTGATAVSFGGTDASTYTVTSSTSITTTAASGTSGSVSVTTPGGTATLAGFTYTSGLPVELTSFTASPAKNGITLNWKTATEVNNYGFEVERRAVSDRHLAWTKIGFMEGNGTTNAPKSYSFTDKSANGKISYRLKQIDRDGKFEYSQTVEVTAASAPKEFALEQNYPNPFNPTTEISYQLSANGFTSLKIYDAIGREVATLVNEVKEAGTYSVQFDGSRLSSGVYFCRMSAAAFTSVTKMTILK